MIDCISIRRETSKLSEFWSVQNYIDLFITILIKFDKISFAVFKKKLLTDDAGQSSHYDRRSESGDLKIKWDFFNKKKSPHNKYLHLNLYIFFAHIFQISF